jgi:phospholipid/cholesterol/gamma-HCH transport system substrate-binding protein
LANLEQTSGRLDRTIAANTSKINSIFNSVDSIAMNLSANSNRITNIITNIDQISDSLARINFAQTIAKADKTLGELDEIMDKINNGDGSLSMLINTDSLHNALLSTNQEVQFLIDDLYMNPWKYVHVSIFGKKPKERFSRKELKQIRDLLDQELKERETAASAETK